MIRTGNCASPLRKVYLSHEILSVMEGGKEGYGKNTWNAVDSSEVSRMLSDSYLWELI